MSSLSPIRFLGLAVVLLLALPAGAQPDTSSDGPPMFPDAVIDIDGQRFDVVEMADDDHLVVITLKATWCTVCQEQLVRLKALLPQLRRCRVNLLVLSPGTRDELAAIRERVDLPATYVVDDGLTIARSLGIAVGDDRIYPCMLQILPDLTIGWRQRGRNGAYFGDGELKTYFVCPSV